MLPQGGIEQIECDTRRSNSIEFYRVIKAEYGVS